MTKARTAGKAPDSAAARLLKLGVAAAVFAATVGSWSLVSGQLLRHTGAALPDGGDDGRPCQLWFIGSSSMQRWTTLASDMRPWIVHKRGVDGASMSDITDRLSHEPPGPRPTAIVFYAGDNDIAEGESAQATIADLNAFLAMKTRIVGAVPVFVVSLKPSPKRWGFLPQQTMFNAAARRIADARPDTMFVNTVPLLLVNGRPGAFYRSDGIHLNPAGYARWRQAIRPALAHGLPAETVRECTKAA